MADNSKTIWDAMLKFIANPYGTAGLMGNLKAESSLNPVCLEKTFRTKLGMTSQAYTDAVDKGTYQEFISDGAGYGLAQWTYPDHKQSLLSYARYKGTSIGDLQTQIEFLQLDLNQFSSVLGVLKTATSVREASDDVLLRYEKPASTTEAVKKKRASYGQAFFDQYADPDWLKKRDKANTVIQSARARLGDPYVFGALGEECTPANRKKYARSDYPDIVNKCPVLSGKASSCAKCDNVGRHIYDCRGFTYRCLKDAGITISTVGATTQWNTTKDWAARGETNDMPDLVCCVFKKRGDKMSHTGLHLGAGYIIHCSGEVKTGYLSDTTWTNWAIPKGLYDDKTIKNAARIKQVATLKKGSTGPEVKALQEKLKALGYDPGTIDGNYGTKTVSAVKAFQKDHLLTVDGIAGMATQAAIDEAVKGGGSSQDKPARVYMTIDEIDKVIEWAQSIKDTMEEVRGR
ncbi:MAG: peptidoglycan-binding protein [Clostridia bacterium]|nr:peptidoglycan-binding protein [Clostridia bacterium]